MRPLWELADWLRQIRRQMRFGELSRSPLELLRLELRGDRVECDWMVRAGDPWDADLPPTQRERHVSEQALKDAMNVRDLLFSEMPGVRSAVLRAYRPSHDGESRELVIAGVVGRDDGVRQGIRSLAMRVKLCGLQFRLDDGVLRALQEQ